jgi:hypothetical protein
MPGNSSERECNGDDLFAAGWDGKLYAEYWSSGTSCEYELHLQLLVSELMRQESAEHGSGRAGNRWGHAA